MKKLLLSIVIVSMLLAGAFLLPTTASAHSTATVEHPDLSCSDSLTLVSNTFTLIVVHINNCLAQSLGTIGQATLTALITKTGVAPAIASSMASTMIANQGLILGVDFSCFGRGVNVGYDPLLGIRITAVCA